MEKIRGKRSGRNKNYRKYQNDDNNNNYYFLHPTFTLFFQFSLPSSLQPFFFPFLLPRLVSFTFKPLIFTTTSSVHLNENIFVCLSVYLRIVYLYIKEKKGSYVFFKYRSKFNIVHYRMNVTGGIYLFI